MDARPPRARGARPLHAEELPLPRPPRRPRAGHARLGHGGRDAQREEDERFALVEARVDLDVTFDPLPPADEMRALVAKGERDCFVGASLTVKPDYHWTVNGEDLS